MKIAIIGGVPESLRGFRGALISRLCRMGHEVTGLAGEDNDEVRRWLAKRGAGFASYPMQRQQTNPLWDLRTCFALYRWLRQEKPDLVLAYTAKPVIWGGTAARLAGIEQFHALITGLGNQFNSETTRQRLMASLMKPLYRLALGPARTVIFQNRDDQQRLVGLGLVRPGQARRVNGSGVNLAFFTPSDLPDGPPVFLTIARLIGAKGLREYAAAARHIRKEFPGVRFQLVGPFEKGSDALSEAEVRQWDAEGTLEYLGTVADAREVMARCHVYVLASYYGEGLPRTILEAMAVGRPVLTTDNVGCRDAVSPGVTGQQVQPRSVAALVEGLRWFLCNQDQWSRMGQQGRARVESEFDVERVNDAMLQILDLEVRVPRPAVEATA